MITNTVGSVVTFLGLIDRHVGRTAHGELALYRGQRDEEWQLVPGIARDPFITPHSIAKDGFVPHLRLPVSAGVSSTKDVSAERRLLIVFRDHAASLLPRWVWNGTEAEVAWNQIVLAQHHRLPTRFLDWSTNPLVALFFAVEGASSVCKHEPAYCDFCAGGEPHPSAVYGLLRRDSFSVASLAHYNSTPPLYAGKYDPGVVRPPDIDGRIVAQGSMMTISKDSAAPIQPDLKFSVPENHRATVLRELDDLGINRRVLFPELDGLATYLTWSVPFWKPNSGVKVP